MSLSAWWLVAAVIVAPLAVFPSSTGVAIPQAKNAVAIVLGLAVVIWRVPTAWGRAFAAWAVLAFMAAGLPFWGVVGLLGILAWLLIYTEAVALTDAGWRRVRWAIALAALGQIGWMALQSVGVDPIFSPVTYWGASQDGPPPAIGWFANPMDTALFLGLSVPALVALSPWLLVVVVPAVVSLNATVGLVGVAVTAVWWAPTQRWRAAIALLLAVGIVGFVMLRDPQGLGRRPMIWQSAAQLAAARPIFGWGANAVGHRIHLLRGLPGRTAGHERWEHVFNEWLQGAVELGMVAPLLVGGYLARLAWRLRSRWHLAHEAVPAVITLVLVSLVSIPLRIGPVAILSALYLGRLEATARGSEA